jgi:hypothetical protein
MAVDFKAKQCEFAAYIRDPERYPAPADVNIQRMAMYRELFFNNIESFLSGNFPVLRTLLDEPQWLAVSYDFFARHVCKTPYFSEIAEEFLAYLQNERNNPGDLPFMLELAHYEWVEMALSNAKEELNINDLNAGGLLEKSISLSPLAWPLIYQYPVHRIAPSFLPLTPPPQPTCLIVYRNRDDDAGFIEITPSTYGLLQLLEENGSLRVDVCLNRMVQAFHTVDPERIRKGALQVIKELAEKNIVTVID